MKITLVADITTSFPGIEPGTLFGTLDVVSDNGETVSSKGFMLSNPTPSKFGAFIAEQAHELLVEWIREAEAGQTDKEELMVWNLSIPEEYAKCVAEVLDLVQATADGRMTRVGLH